MGALHSGVLKLMRRVDEEREWTSGESYLLQDRPSGCQESEQSSPLHSTLHSVSALDYFQH